MRDIINGLRGEGTAVFLNSHLLSEVEQTCDRVAFVRQGVVLSTANVADFDADKLQVVVRVGQPSPQLLADLGQFDREVAWENGRYHLTLPHESDLPRLASWLVGHNHTLYEFTPTRLSLEDRFLQIIGEDTGQ